ncbi:hypothetical protein [Rhizobium sp. 18065]|uniref:hypothetical protein n=1 Tax=Rhizobium sp. 18065 TaxID=2681411 RepID=UPI001357A6BF|nr:hypothetical protein [Rhizobium sp. 18065]
MNITHKIDRTTASKTNGFSIGDKVHYKDATVEGVGVISGILMHGSIHALNPLVVRMDKKDDNASFASFTSYGFHDLERPFNAAELKKIEEPTPRAFRDGDEIALLEPYGGYKEGSAFVVTGVRGDIVDALPIAGRTAKINRFSGSRPPIHCYGKRLKLLKEAPQQLTGTRADMIIMDDVTAPASRTAAKPFRVGDLIERIGDSDTMFGERGKQYTVLHVNKHGEPAVIHADQHGIIGRYKLIKTAEQSAMETVTQYAMPTGRLFFPILGRKDTPPTPTKAPAKPRQFRVIAADGSAVASRVWDNFDAAQRDASKRADRCENYREFLVVEVVAKAKAEKLKVITYKRGAVAVEKV